MGVYELVDREGKSLGGEAMFPVIELPGPDGDGKLRSALILETEKGRAVPFGTALEHPGGVLEPLFIEAIPDPVPAEPGWVVEMWTPGTRDQPPSHLGTYEILAWEPALRTNAELPPEGHALVLVREPSEWNDSGPMSTRFLPGMGRYRRKDDPPYGPPDFMD